MKIRAPGTDERLYDNCGCLTIAILEHNDELTIPLCEECFDELISSVNKLSNTVFCKDCKRWHASKYGVIYGGTCEVMAGEKFKDFTEKDYGYRYCTDYCDTCEHAIRKISKEK